MLGAHSQELDIDEEHAQMFANEFKGPVEAKAGCTYSTFEPCKFTKQVVAGMIYKIKYKVDGDKYVLVKIYKPLPYMNQPPECQEFMDNQAADAALTSLP